jgi:uncharacterized protein YuzE
MQATRSRFGGLTTEIGKLPCLTGPLLSLERHKTPPLSSGRLALHDLSDTPSAQSEEVAEGILLDFDEGGQLVGIDIDHASKIVDVAALKSGSAPIIVSPTA